MTVDEIIRIIKSCKEEQISHFTFQFGANEKVVVDFLNANRAASPEPLDYMRMLQATSNHNTFRVASAQPSPSEAVKFEELVKGLSPFEEMSEKEILYAATPYYDELQAEKAKHQEKIDNEIKK